MPTLGDLLTYADRKFNAPQGYGPGVDMARGAAAATVPSWLGGPVDLATMLLNVPMAAFGKKIEQPIGGSEHLARLSGLAGPAKESGAPMNSYDKGYLLSSLLQMAAPMVAPAVASRGRVAPTNQTGAVGMDVRKYINDPDSASTLVPWVHKGERVLVDVPTHALDMGGEEAVLRSLQRGEFYFDPKGVR